MHFRKHINNTLTQFWIQRHFGTMPCFTIVKISRRYAAGEHFLKAESLGGKLQIILIGFLWLAALIFYRHRQIQPFSARDIYATFILTEFNNIAYASGT
ncbi:putative membrane protein [[Clostridium] cellulosi]|uniref:Putative membrane protein n=1 Tax=[Clostridium] cellulosi TaxID=29343 RepID=A0A078KRS4_9FIRM|nr:putative membrane protein [[Clostridium] cellulosi]